MSKLRRIKGFYFFLMVVFCNSFVDLGHKILIQDTLYQTEASGSYTVLAAILNAFILLPYLFLFTPSGFIADKWPKAKVLRLTALLAIPLTALICLCYFLGYFWLAYFLTLLLAAQSALNSPAKYGYIKELVGKSLIAKANAYVQTLAIISILAGTVVFTGLFSYFVHPAIVANKSLSSGALLQTFAPLGFLLVIFSTLEWFITCRLPLFNAVDPSSQYDIKKYYTGKYLKRYLQIAKSDNAIFISILGLSLFWGINQVLLACFGSFIKETMPDASVLFVQSSMALGGIGILTGAMYVGRISRGFIETGVIPLSTVGIAGCLYLLPNLTHQWSFYLLFLGYGFFGGMLIVPLNALIQFKAGKKVQGKVLAANNFIQNVFMVCFLIVTVGLAEFKVSSVYMLYGLAILASLGCVYSFIKLPQSLTRYLVYVIMSKFYHIEVMGIDNIPNKGGVLLLGNHVSFIDWALLQIVSPRPIRFVMERSIYEKWYLKWILKKFKVIPIATGGSTKALKTVKEALSNGECVCLFPEGRLSINGMLGKFHSGFERAIKETNAVIVPFYLLGLWGSRHSYAPASFRQHLQLSERIVSVSFGHQLTSDITALSLRQVVNDLSVCAWSNYAEHYESIAHAWIKTAKSNLSALSVKEGVGLRLSNMKLIAAVWWLQSKIKKKIKSQVSCGLLLPASGAGVMANLACLSLGKTVVNLNFTIGADNFKKAIQQSNIKTIISSRKFIEKIQSGLPDLERLDVDWIYLEDIRKRKSSVDIAIRSIFVKLLPEPLLTRILLTTVEARQTATILFSSGSESTPKGVCLSHGNILSNIKQLSSVLALEKNDAMLCSLPLFHAFGLTVTTLLPLIQGLPIVCSPDPTNGLVVAKAVAKHQVTIMCATPTLLGVYARNTKIPSAYFKSLRIVIAGAERLTEETRLSFKEKFNCEVYQGYGATEASPVMSTNLPDSLSTYDLHVYQSHVPQTVGHALPGTSFKIVDPDSFDEKEIGEAGMIMIAGPQLMTGYLNDEKRTSKCIKESDNMRWYITGDKGYLDDKGFLTLVDRYSRIAKIGGEMVSLSYVEENLKGLFGGSVEDLMVVASDDSKKGQALNLLYCGEASEEVLKTTIRDSDMPPLLKPKRLLKVAELPKLGSGKKDFNKAKQLVTE